MTDKRFFKREYEEEYYIFDSQHISETKVDEEIEYGYEVFADSMQGNEVIDKLNNQEQLIKELKQENRQLKITYAKCRDCKHANMYSPDFAFLVIDPKCGLNVKAITSESNACEDFELIGRCSR